MTATTTSAEAATSGGGGPGPEPGSRGERPGGSSSPPKEKEEGTTTTERRRKVVDGANADAEEDAFLSSMTFARMTSRPDCDCDECGGLCGDPLPPQIADAVRRYKRAKLVSSLWEGGSIVEPTQERELVARDSAVVVAGTGTGTGGDEVTNVTVAVWRWTLPPGARPLVEYGNTDRIVFVESMPKGSKLVSIGRGILGSSDEEADRIDLPWTDGGAYLLPSNGGKALGWIHERGRSNGDGEVGVEGKEEGADGDGGGNVVLVMVKVTKAPASASAGATAGDDDGPTTEADGDEACRMRRVASVFHRNVPRVTARSSTADDGAAPASSGAVGGDGGGGSSHASDGIEEGGSAMEDERVGIALGEYDRAIVREVLSRVAHE